MILRAVILAALFLPLVAAVEIAQPVAGVRVYFTPGDDAQGAAIAEIGKAKSTVLVMTYSFTSVPIAKALAEAFERGVSVRVISDKENETSKYTALDFVAGKGAEVLVDDKVRIAHNKVMVIDGQVVITGSFNWTKAAQESNAENLLVLPSAELAAAYAANWEARKAVSRPYVRRSDR
jgi:phosphatidylserine/phosphatidylglycerophosphate/cardiolipin synthase-like enzyme